jgi:hypothetical protein
MPPVLALLFSDGEVLVSGVRAAWADSTPVRTDLLSVNTGG